MKERKKEAKQWEEKCVEKWAEALEANWRGAHWLGQRRIFRWLQAVLAGIYALTGLKVLGRKSAACYY